MDRATLVRRLTTPTVEFNYLGLEPRYAALETAHAVVLPVPYDGTTSYRPGARFGPSGLIAASRNMEVYDELLGALYPHGIHTLPELDVVADAEAMVARVEEAAEWVLEQEKALITVGGEHSLSTGPVRAYARRFPKLSVLHVDAHGDPGVVPDSRPRQGNLAGILEQLDPLEAARHSEGSRAGLRGDV